LEAREIRPQRPVRRRDALTGGEAEARALTAGLTAQVVGAERRPELRLRRLRIARQAPAANELLDDRAQRDWPGVAVERGHHHERRVRELLARELVALAERDVDPAGQPARHDLL